MTRLLPSSLARVAVSSLIAAVAPLSGCLKLTTTDPPLLSVIDISPDPGARGIDPATSIRITFSEPVRCASAKAGIAVTETFDAHPHRGAQAGRTTLSSGTLTCTEPASTEQTDCEDDACVVTFTPSLPFLLSSNVTITITGGARADGAVESFRSTAAGGQLPATVTGSFSVLDPPALLLANRLVPGNGAIQVGLDATLTLSFSEELDCATTTGAIAVTETLADGSSAPLGIASAHCDGSAVVVRFDRALSYSATVDVTVAAIVESARATTRGGQLVGGAGLSFSTIDPPPLLALSSTPGDDSKQVDLDADIVVEFSEALDCGSVTPAAFTVVETFDALVALRLGNASVAHPVSVTCDGSRVYIVVPRYQHTSAIDVAIAGSVRSARATLLGGQLNDGAGHTLGFTTTNPVDLFLAHASPANGSTGIGVGSSLTLEFSEAIDCATVVAEDVVVTEAFAQHLLGQNPGTPATMTRPVAVASCAGASLVLAPAVDFELSSRVTVALPGAIASAQATTARGRLNGGAGLSYAFTIIPFPPVEVLSVLPDSGLIAQAPTFRVTFNQSVLVPVTSLKDLTQTQVFLVETDDTDAPPDITRAVALQCQECQTGAAFTFAPATPLIDGQHYALVIRGGAAGVRGSVDGWVMLANVIKRYLVVYAPPDGEPITAEDFEWTWVSFPDAKCRDGSSTGIGVNLNSASDRVMIFLQGGGACFNGLSCPFNFSSYGEDDFNGPNGGIFNRDNPNNPVADFNFVFVPYCTGDVHSGNRPNSMVPGVGVQQFMGYANMVRYLDRIVPTFPDAEQVLLAGASAGGFGATLTTDLVRKTFGPVPVTLLDDSGPPLSGNYIAPCLQALWRDLWGLDQTLLADCGSDCPDDSDFMLDFAKHLGTVYPGEPAALISSRQDEVIRLFLSFGENGCNGGFYSGTKYSEGLDDLASQLAGPSFGTYYIAGNQHTVLEGAGFYGTTVSGVPLTQWVADLLAGTTSDVAP